MRDNISPQLETLKLVYPFTKQELDHTYRTRAFECHPDKGGDAKEFINVKDAYDILLPMCVLANEKDIITHTTIEGDLIFNLGNGLGDLVNSSDCLECQGKGWHKTTHTSYGTGKICPVCDGRGEVRTANKSLIWWLNWRPCRRCKGLGSLGFTEVQHETLHTCHNCKGAGQIEIMNPALKKGRMQRQKQVNKSNKKRYCTCGARITGSKCWRCEETLTKTVA